MINLNPNVNNKHQHSRKRLIFVNILILIAFPHLNAKSHGFLGAKTNPTIAATYEQPLAWASAVEIRTDKGANGNLTDVMFWKDQHLEQISLVTDKIINHERVVIEETMSCIYKTRKDNEIVREQRRGTLEEIIAMVHIHIPSNNAKASIASFSPNLRSINLQHLKIDEKYLKKIMILAVGDEMLQFLHIDIITFTNELFSIKKWH